MKIVLIAGVSGSGKTSICKNLCERYPDKYHFVNSFTDRKKRKKDEWGHAFISSIEMDDILKREDIVAQTKIESNRYCTIKRQFEKNKINLYTVDTKGINDVIYNFNDAKIIKVLIRRDDVEADCIRTNRDIDVPLRDDVDLLIDNNGTIESSANLLNSFVNFDFFVEPFKFISLNDKLDYIDMNYRFLDEIKESIYEQMWYRDLKMYQNLCKYVEEKINKEFDFNVTITPDTSPEIFDGYMTYNIQGVYEDGNLMWDELHRLIEKMSYYAYEFGEKNNCDDIICRLSISEEWCGENEYR